MTRILAKEVAAKGVTANVVAPGPVRTELFLAGKDEAFLRRVEQQSMGRIAETTDVAPVVAFLASDAPAVGEQPSHQGQWGLRLKRGRCSNSIQTVTPAVCE